MGIQHIGIIKVNYRNPVFRPQLADCASNHCLGQKFAPFLPEHIMENIGQGRHKYNVCLRVRLFQPTHQLVQIPKKSSWFTFFHCAKILLVQAETVVGPSHNNDQVCILRYLPEPVHKGVFPISSNRRAADSQVCHVFRPQQLFQPGGIRILLVVFHIIQVRCLGNAVPKAGNGHAGEVKLLMGNDL